MKNGLIYVFFNSIIEGLKYFSLVELFKWLASKMFVTNNSKARKIAVDIFILLKWSFVLSAFIYRWNNPLFNILVWYLIFTNIYTYFYYHVWDKDSLHTDLKIDRVRRRFLNLLLSVGFSNFCFAYLYRFSYYDHFKWIGKSEHSLSAVWFSMANSLTSNYEFVVPKTQFGNELALMQLFLSFMFFTIILAKSIPQTSSSN